MRQCWICFAEEEEEGGGGGERGERGNNLKVINPESNSSSPKVIVQELDWVRPCQCRGTTQWVHQHCLLSWLEASSTNGEPLLVPKAQCPQCHTEYRLSEKVLVPRWILTVLDRAAAVRDTLLLYAAATGLGLGAYVTAWSYGMGVTIAILGRQEIMQTLVGPLSGRFGGFSAMTALRAIIAIPMVPLYVLSLRHSSLTWLHPLVPALVYDGPSSLRLLQWPISRSTLTANLPLIIIFYEEFINRRFYPYLRQFLISEISEVERVRNQTEANNSPASIQSAEVSFTLSSLDTAALTSPVDSDLIIVGDDDRTLKVSVVGTAATLLLPFAAATIGWLLFGRMRLDPLHRSVLGGVLIVFTRDLLRTLTWYQRILSRRTRRVLDYVL